MFRNFIILNLSELNSYKKIGYFYFRKAIKLKKPKT